MPYSQKRGIALALLLFFVAALGRSSTGGQGISQSEYQARRARLITLMDTSEAIVMKAADPRLRSNDVNYRYRQESNFFYVTGLNSSGHFVLFVPRGITVDGVVAKVVLFFAASADDAEKPTAGTQEIVLGASRFDEIFRGVMPAIKTLYVSSPDLRMTFDWLNGKPLFVDRDARRELEQKYTGLKIKNPSAYFSRLRVIKSRAEIGMIEKAIDLTADGIQKALKTCRPDGYEYELQAAIESSMTGGGADYTGFPSIIGSGENSLILHYDKNRRQMKSGEVVIMDVGAEYEGYSADITRTIPVSGKFTSAQAEVYTVVLQTLKEVEKFIRPGVSTRDVEKKARDVIAAAGYQKYIRHGVSHNVGLDVHDLGGIADTLKPGMVITVEPGLYIPSDDTTLKPEYRGFGVRIEDDVLVTQDGCTVLTLNAPREIKDIETAMKKRK
jgi:Xaa-Pro aminopeptidase